jgi:hypothetical protein
MKRINAVKPRAEGRYKTYYTEVYDKITHLQKDMI